jgi:hypothetical protein
LLAPLGWPALGLGARTGLAGPALRWSCPFRPAAPPTSSPAWSPPNFSKAAGQPVVVENKPGAGTVIGVDAVAKSPADGHSFVTVANSFCVNQTLVKNLPYDSQRDLRRWP